MNKIRKSMEGIRASEELKQKTLAYVEEQRQKQLCSKRHRNPKFALAAACIVLFCAAGGYGVYQSPTAYLSIDVNPSVELEINRFGRVVSVQGYNEDGVRVVNQVRLKNLPYAKAVEQLLESEKESGYLSEDTLVVFTVISDNSEDILQELQEDAVTDYNTLTYESDVYCRQQAHEHEMSFGKYEVYLELSEYDTTVTVEDCHNMTMQEIQTRIESCHGHQYLEQEETESETLEQSQQDSVLQEEFVQQENHKEHEGHHGHGGH